MEIIGLTMIGVAAGFLSGLLGVGGATILIPALVFIFHQSQHLAQGTSLTALLLPVGALAAVKYWQAGNIDLKFALVLAFGFLIGGYFGGWLAQPISDEWLRKLFAVYLLLISLQMLFAK